MLVGNEQVKIDSINETFQATLPCVDCGFNTICKHYQRFATITIPEPLEVTYKCKEKEKFESMRKG